MDAEENKEHERLKDMLKRALPYLQGYDLMGTGSSALPFEVRDLNTLEKEIAEVIGEDPNEHGCHSKYG